MQLRSSTTCYYNPNVTIAENYPANYQYYEVKTLFTEYHSSKASTWKKGRLAKGYKAQFKKQTSLLPIPYKEIITMFSRYK